MTPIYVPSRGRVDSPTARHLYEEGIPFSFVVRDVEAKEYRKHWPDVTVYGIPAWGIGPTRQAIFFSCQTVFPSRWHWQLDDDLTGFFYRDDALMRTGGMGDGRHVPITFGDALQGMEAVVEEHPTVMLAGPQFRQFAWSSEAPWDYNLAIRNALLIRSDAPAAFWPYVKEDLDFALQILTQGGDTMRFNRWAISSPKMGSLEGGCREDYEAGALPEASRRLAEKWGPEIMTLHDGPGYVENRVKWRQFKRPVPQIGPLQTVAAGVE